MRFLWWCVAAFWTAHVIGKPLLNQATVWRLNLQLKKTNYEPLNCILNVRFTLDKGYEPPSGQVYIENDSLGFANTNERGVSGLWTLSEDKNDRKVPFTYALHNISSLVTKFSREGRALGVGFI